MQLFNQSGFLIPTDDEPLTTPPAEDLWFTEVELSSWLSIEAVPDLFNGMFDSHVV